jgi:uncharacterized protein
MAADSTTPERNKALVQASFNNWRSGTGSSKQEFLDNVIHPFNARMATRLVPTVRGIYADGDTVITLFDATATAKDGVPYHNTYTWYFQFNGANVVKALAFFDTRDFDEFWTRVKPQE